MNNNYIKVKIEGRNVNNYIKWLIKQKINIINLNIIKYNHLEVIIDYKDYKNLKKYSKTYKITIIKKYGPLKIIEILKNNSFILISVIIGIIFLYFLSNVIFSIDVIYNDQEMVGLIKKELKKYGIAKYKLKKDYLYLDKVKEDILKNNNDTLEYYLLLRLDNFIKKAVTTIHITVFLFISVYPIHPTPSTYSEQMHS